MSNTTALSIYQYFDVVDTFSCSFTNLETLNPHHDCHISFFMSIFISAFAVNVLGPLTTTSIYIFILYLLLYLFRLFVLSLYQVQCYVYKFITT